jgi:hypothetical protein
LLPIQLFAMAAKRSHHDDAPALLVVDVDAHFEDVIPGLDAWGAALHITLHPIMHSAGRNFTTSITPTRFMHSVQYRPTHRLAIKKVVLNLLPARI